MDKEPNKFSKVLANIAGAIFVCAIGGIVVSLAYKVCTWIVGW